MCAFASIFHCLLHISLNHGEGHRFNLHLLLANLRVFILLFAGGLTAVIWTDTVQTVIMLGGAFAVSGLGRMRWKFLNVVFREYFTNGMCDRTTSCMLAAYGSPIYNYIILVLACLVFVLL